MTDAPGFNSGKNFCTVRMTATASRRTLPADRNDSRGSAQSGFEVSAEDGGQHGVGDPGVTVSLQPVANGGVVADRAQVIDESLTDSKFLNFDVG